MTLVSLNGYAEDVDLDDGERRIVEALKDGPCTLDELAKRVDALGWQFFNAI